MHVWDHPFHMQYTQHSLTGIPILFYKVAYLYEYLQSYSYVLVTINVLVRFAFEQYHVTFRGGASVLLLNSWIHTK